MPPSGLRSRNFAIGEPSPNGSRSSILVLGNVMKTVVTPWAGCGMGSGTAAPSVSRWSRDALAISRTAIATWLSRPIMVFLLWSGDHLLAGGGERRQRFGPTE